MFLANIFVNRLAPEGITMEGSYISRLVHQAAKRISQFREHTRE